MASVILRCEGLSFAYADQPAVLTDWSASLGPGLALIHGDSGTGKSTLLRLLAGRLQAVGTRAINGHDIAEQPALYRQSLYYTEPDTTEFDALSAIEYAAQARAAHAAFDESAWQSHLDGFGLRPHEAKPLTMLSTGSKRKVWLSAALAGGWPLILLDEPTAALDMASIHYLQRALRQASQRPDQLIVIASFQRDWPMPISQVIELSAD